MVEVRGASIFLSKSLEPKFIQEQLGEDPRFDMSCRRNPDKTCPEFGKYSHLLEVELEGVDSEVDATQTMREKLNAILRLAKTQAISAETVWAFEEQLDGNGRVA
jgi:hypothetical protein